MWLSPVLQQRGCPPSAWRPRGLGGSAWCCCGARHRPILGSRAPVGAPVHLTSTGQAAGPTAAWPPPPGVSRLRPWVGDSGHGPMLREDGWRLWVCTCTLAAGPSSACSCPRQPPGGGSGGQSLACHGSPGVAGGEVGYRSCQHGGCRLSWPSGDMAARARRPPRTGRGAGLPRAPRAGRAFSRVGRCVGQSWEKAGVGAVGLAGWLGRGLAAGWSGRAPRGPWPLRGVVPMPR